MATRVTVDENGFIVAVEPASGESLGPAVKRRTYKRTGRAKASTTGSLKLSRENAKRRAVFPTRKPLVQCKFCSSKVQEDNLSKHITEVHPDKKPSATTTRKPQPALRSRRKTVLTKPQPRKLPPKDLLPTQLQSKKSLVQCSICQQNIRADKWDKHLKKVHAGCTTKVSNSPSTMRNVSGEPKARKSSSRKGGGASFDPDIRRKALRELHEETIYGDKYVGQFHRDADGRFGSIPLYDDYSEESGA